MMWEIRKDLRSWLPRLQSHRGYWVKGLPENTLASIQEAARLGYQMVEFDVRLTSDDQVVLFHDESITSYQIRHTPYSEFVTVVQMNTLEQIFEWAQKNSDIQIKFNIELKTAEKKDATLEKWVVALIEKYHFEGRVLVSSFNPLALMRVRKLNSKIFRALLLTLESHPFNKWYLRGMVLNFLAKPHMLNLRYVDWSNRRMQRIAKKIPVILWTFNSVKDVKYILTKVHGVISDEITPEQIG